jgi:acyl-CoA synthetase (AMP-forming)/AMP-acid ligase II
MTYSQLLSKMKSVASGLSKKGLKRGDNLVVICGNHVELPLMSMAVWRAGGTLACLSVNLPQGTESQMSRPFFHDIAALLSFDSFYFCYLWIHRQDVMELRIREMGSKFVLTDYARADRIVDVVKRLDFVREIFVIGDKHVEGCTFFSELMEDSGEGHFFYFCIFLFQFFDFFDWTTFGIRLPWKS